MTEFRNARNEAYHLRVGVVTPGCSSGGNPIGLVSICPAITGGFINIRFNGFKSMTVSTGSYTSSLIEMTLVPGPACVITGSCYDQVV